MCQECYADENRITPLLNPMYEIRIATNSDRYEIGNVYCESWKSAYQNILPQIYLDSLTAENCMPSKVSFDDIVLEEKGHILGICHVSEARSRDKSIWGEIVAIYLLPEMWGTGAGGELLEKAFLKLKQKSLKNVCLWVLKYNKRARSFYEKSGFQISGNELDIEIAKCSVREVEYIYYG